MQLVSYVKNPIGYRQSDGREYITVDDVGRLKAAFKGRGILYSWVQGPGRYAFLNCQFSLQQMTQIECFTDQPGRISLELEAQPRTPCSGIRTSTGEGYIISPAFRLEPTEGPNIFLMTLVPRTSPCNVEVEKSVLAISKDESVVTVTSDAGEVRCSGTISGQTRMAEIVLNRNLELPEFPVYRAGFNQTLTELKGQGSISALWRPVIRTFEEHVFAFYPSTIGSNRLDLGPVNLDALANYLGAPGSGDPGEFDDYVIGDGPGVKHALRLKIDRGLGRHDTDETRLTLT